MRFGNWDGHLLLIDKEIFDLLPDGVELVTINGDTLTKGVDKMDFDTRAGLLAYGFRTEVKEIV
jgi:hypothetical protein